MANDFNKRVFGCVVIKSLNSNYNADFTHQPRTLPDGTVYATDKTLKYMVRNYLKKAFPDEKIFYFKSLDADFKPRTLDESYKLHFGDFPIKGGKNPNTTEKEEFFLFKYDGTSVAGLIPAKPKAGPYKTYFTSLPENSELKDLKSSFDKLKKKSESKTVAFVKQELGEDEEEGFFYVDGGIITRIQGNFADIEIVSNDIDNMVTGGVDRKAFLSNLLRCVDIRLFGGTYPGRVSFSIHGPVQITHGIDQYRRGQIYSEQIMSPFRNSTEKNQDSTMTTLGTQSKLSEGHYVHGFSINPRNIADHVTLSEGTALQNDDIEKLKMALSAGATFYDSAAKSGTENELLLWIQLKEGSIPRQIPSPFGSLEDTFSELELAFLSRFDIETDGNSISGTEVWKVYKSVLFNRTTGFGEQQINKKVISGILSKFTFSVFASRQIKAALERFSFPARDKENGLRGFENYIYLAHHDDCYDYKMGLLEAEFEAFETFIL